MRYHASSAVIVVPAGAFSRQRAPMPLPVTPVVSVSAAQRPSSTPLSGVPAQSVAVCTVLESALGVQLLLTRPGAGPHAVTL